jgi:uncharacterized damage-inducible protein DinB
MGAVAAILEVYEKAVTELKELIADISDKELDTIVDPVTTDPNCKSIQSVLTHVVSAGHNYAVNIQRLSHADTAYFSKITRNNVKAYREDLDRLMAYTHSVLGTIRDDELERFDDSEKMKTSWGQTYDIEQMMEHAIVHILRHHRQVERFMGLLRP